MHIVSYLRPAVAVARFALPVCLSLAILSGAAIGQTVEGAGDTFKVAGTELKFPAPDNMCLADVTNATDAALVNQLKQVQAQTGNTLYTVFLNCDQLEAFRANPTTPPQNYGVTFSPTLLIGKPLEMNREQYLQETREQALTEARSAAEMMDKATQGALKTTLIDSLKGDQNANTYGMIVEMAAVNLKQVGVVASTTLKNVPVFALFYEPYSNDDHVVEMEGTALAYVSKLIGQNPDNAMTEAAPAAETPVETPAEAAAPSETPAATETAETSSAQPVEEEGGLPIGLIIGGLAGLLAVGGGAFFFLRGRA